MRVYFLYYSSLFGHTLLVPLFPFLFFFFLFSLSFLCLFPLLFPFSFSFLPFFSVSTQFLFREVTCTHSVHSFNLAGLVTKFYI